MNRSKVKINKYHPGTYIRDVIEELGMNQQEFAKRLRTTDQMLSKLLNGEIKLLIELADKLSTYLNTSIDVWMNLQTNYDHYLLSLSKEEG